MINKEDSKELKNSCPICKKERIYKTSTGFSRANKKNLACKSCSNSIKKGGSGNVQPKNGCKTCIDCKEVKELINFYFFKSKNNFHSVCKECNAKRCSDYHINYYRFNKYGINKEYYLQLVTIQENKCFSCKKEVELFIDHNHKTGVVRGLLCRDCNSALGLLQENKEILTNLIKYLTIHE